MNKQKVKFALYSINDDILNVTDKFLRLEIFSFHDLCWWVNPDNHWVNNKNKAEKLLKILEQEECCERISARNRNGLAYKITDDFILLLNEIERIEEILRENNCVRKT